MIRTATFLQLAAGVSVPVLGDWYLKGAAGVIVIMQSVIVRMMFSFRREVDDVKKELQKSVHQFQVSLTEMKTFLFGINNKNGYAEEVDELWLESAKQEGRVKTTESDVHDLQRDLAILQDRVNRRRDL